MSSSVRPADPTFDAPVMGTDEAHSTFETAPVAASGHDGRGLRPEGDVYEDILSSL